MSGSGAWAGAAAACGEEFLLRALYAPRDKIGSSKRVLFMLMNQVAEN